MPPVEPPTPVLGASTHSATNSPFLRGHVDAVGVAVGCVDEPVARYVDRQVADEVAWASGRSACSAWSASSMLMSASGLP